MSRIYTNRDENIKAYAAGLTDDLPSDAPQSIGESISLKLAEQFRNSSGGSDGKDGADGYTPVKGTDYWTDEDKAEIVAEVAESVDVTEGCVTAVTADATGLKVTYTTSGKTRYAYPLMWSDIGVTWSGSTSGDDE